jgi:hypothetical protein
LPLGGDIAFTVRDSSAGVNKACVFFVDRGAFVGSNLLAGLCGIVPRHNAPCQRQRWQGFFVGDSLDGWLMKSPIRQLQDYLLYSGTQDEGLRAALVILAAMLLFPFLICGGCCIGLLTFDFVFSGM